MIFEDGTRQCKQIDLTLKSGRLEPRGSAWRVTIARRVRFLRNTWVKYANGSISRGEFLDRIQSGGWS